MGELVVKYAGQSLAVDRRDEAAAIIKTAGISEALTSIIAYLLLYLLAPLAAVYFAKDASVTPWIRLYGLALLVNLMTETSTAVLQVGNHFRSQAVLQFIQSVITFGGIVLAYFLHGGILAVLLAYLIGKTVYGLGLMAAGLRWMRPTLGAGWARASFHLLPNPRQMAGFAFSTNLSATINLLVRDSEILWIGFLLSPLQAGYYKLALSVMGLMLLPINPLIATTFPEISRAIARHEWLPLRNLLRRTSSIAAAWTFACLAGVLLVGGPFLAWYKGGEYAPALPVILILFAGYGTANILFWNRPLLLALGKPNDPLVITGVSGLLKTLFMLVLVRPFGYLMQAGLLSAYFVASVGLIAWRGIREIQTHGQMPQAEELL
jgi:O-antigen/teichoic acid export membrane protein